MTYRFSWLKRVDFSTAGGYPHGQRKKRSLIRNKEFRRPYSNGDEKIEVLNDADEADRLRVERAAEKREAERKRLLGEES
jgi:hypothetical protein